MSAGLAALAWVRAAARRRVQEVRDAWTALGDDRVHAAIDAILAAPAAYAPTLERTPPLTPALPSAPPRTGAGVDAIADPAWRSLCERFALDRGDECLLALLTAVHAEPQLGRVLGYLADDAYAHPPSPTAAAHLFGLPPGDHPGPASALVRWSIAAPLEPRGWHPAAEWSLDPDIAAYLWDAAEWWKKWPGIEHVAAQAGALPCLFPQLLAELWTAASGLSGGGARPALELELVGRPGSGRRTLLLGLCAALTRDAVLIAQPELGVRALRTARLLDAVPIWIADEPTDVCVEQSGGALTLVARSAPSPPRPADGTLLRLSFTMPELSRTRRLALWHELTGAPPPPPVQRWTLTPAEVVAAAAAAPAGAAIAAGVTRRRLSGVGGALLTPVMCPYAWEDLVLPQPVMEQLRELEAQVRLADEVLDGWGFRRLTPERRGITALFSGPSGTGKTMAASVLARSLELDLYRVDLAQVVNKYVGETEKRLAQVFDECERARVLVLFDEADALFGQRTKVRDAHDRFANIEIDYLLQRMDSFDGVAVLATNRRGDLDPAFVRRIRTVVDFLTPTAVERRRLWDLALPQDPRGEVIGEIGERGWLAQALPMTAADIKAAALGAAFLARAAGEPIGTEHVLAAVRREFAKSGRVLRDAPTVLAPSTNGYGNGPA